MALRIVCKTYKPNDDIRVGYKVYVRPQCADDYSYMCEYQTEGYSLGTVAKASGPGPKGENQTLRGRGLRPHTRGVYAVGFHLFSTLKGARNYVEKHDSVCKLMGMRHYNFLHAANELVIVECTAWDIRADGLQFDEQVFVAKNIKLMKEIPS